MAIAITTVTIAITTPKTNIFIKVPNDSFANDGATIEKITADTAIAVESRVNNNGNWVTLFIFMLPKIFIAKAAIIVTIPMAIPKRAILNIIGKVILLILLTIISCPKIKAEPATAVAIAANIIGSITTVFISNFFKFLIAYPITNVIAPIATPSRSILNIVGQLRASNDFLFIAKTFAESEMPSAIAAIAAGRTTIAASANLPSEFISFPIPIDTTANIPAIKIAVIACIKLIGVTMLRILDDAKIPTDIAAIMSGRDITAAAILPIPMLCVLKP